MTQLTGNLYGWYPETNKHSDQTVRRSDGIPQLPRQRATLSEPQVTWGAPVRDRLNEICALRKSWDGYRAVPTKWDTAHFAFELLRMICKPTTPAPSIVPLPSGGLQIEWHNSSGDFQLLVEAPYKVTAWSASLDPEDDGVEIDLTSDYSPVLEWFDRLV